MTDQTGTAADVPPGLFEGVASVPARIGATPDLDDHHTGTLPLVDELCRHGVPLASALMMLADTVVGMRFEELIEEWTFTTDYSVRLATTAIEGPVRVRSRPLRHGRRLMVDRFDFHDAAGTRVGTGQITFMRTPLRPGEVKPDIAVVRRLMATTSRPSLEVPFVEAAGIELVDAAQGVVRLRPHDGLRRPGGFVQGAIMTLVGEVAALELAEHHIGAPCVVTALDVRYLIGGRTGPIETRAEFVGDPALGQIVVEVVDRGHDDAVTTTFIVGVTPAG